MKIKIFALGGLNERGKNMYVVEVEDEIYVMDAGLKYPDDKMLGIDYIIPNFGNDVNPFDKRCQNRCSSEVFLMAFQKIKSVPQENALNAVIYARYSSTQQTENSIDGQLRECNRFADLHGYRIIGTYIDRAKSGTSVEERTDFLRMIEDAKKQQFAYIIVYRFDRFARNRYDSVIYKKQLSAFRTSTCAWAQSNMDWPARIFTSLILAGLALVAVSGVARPKTPIFTPVGLVKVM